MLRYATDKALPTKITLFDSNRDRNNILYKSEFDSWASKNRNIKIVYSVTDEKSDEWRGERRRIDKNMLTKYLTDGQISDSIFYVCGPPEMLNAMREILQELQIPDDRMKAEEFTGY